MKTWHIVLIAGLIAGALFAVRRLSGRGLAFIKRFESLSLTPYPDQGGRLTIGWGHLIKPGESFPPAITRQLADTILASDVANAEQAVKSLVKVPLSANQYDALTSLVFNIGAGNFQTSTLLKKLNAGDYQGAAAEFPRWHFAGGTSSAGLLARRAQEQQTFLS